MLTPRVLLLVPPGSLPSDGPLIGLRWVAAAFAGAGCEVRVRGSEGAGPEESPPPDPCAEVRSFGPHLVGLSLYTPTARLVYDLLPDLRDAAPGPAPLLVAGGPHATVRPRECLERGFDFVAVGEGEETAADLAEVLRGRRDPADVPGLGWRSPDGAIHLPEGPRIVADLDSLPPLPWLDPEPSAASPAGILTSRGCPGRCTFCSNHVSGHRYRYRSPDHVLTELRFHRRQGRIALSFWDTAFTADPVRTRTLARRIAEGVPGLRFSAATRVDQVTPELLDELAHAGLAALHFGVESGDDLTLRRMRKGQTVARIVRALAMTREAGILTCASFILGFPGETPAAIGRTLRFMEEIAPITDVFSPHVVLIPWPGTPIYEEHHRSGGFTDWWLEDANPVEGLTSRLPVDEPVLARDFFRYPAEVPPLIREALRFISDHNTRRAAGAGV